MVMNQTNHQNIGAANLQQITSNKGPPLTIPPLWFQLSWVYLIIMPLIMFMLSFTHQIYQLNLTLNQFQIQTPLRLNQFMMMKWIISWNYYIQNMIKTLCMLTSRWSKIDWWSPLLQNFIQSLLCFFINMEERMFQSRIACHNFLYLSQPRTL